jgi:hypothetical protein
VNGTQNLRSLFFWNVMLCKGVVGSCIMQPVDGWLNGLEIQPGATLWASHTGVFGIHLATLALTQSIILSVVEIKYTNKLIQGFRREQQGLPGIPGEQSPQKYHWENLNLQKRICFHITSYNLISCIYTLMLDILSSSRSVVWYKV